MADATHPYPERQGEPDCIYYMRTGSCGYGTNCRFNHPPNAKVSTVSSSTKDDRPQRIGEPDCQYYLRTGTCKFGALCKYHHPHEKIAAPGGQAELNYVGLPMRPGEKECAYYLRTGSCKYSLACKFHHPQPEAVRTMIPVQGSPFYVTNTTPAAPVPFPYVTGYPSSRAVTRSQYMCGPHMQGFSGYVPVIVSPSHGIAVPGWNTYEGSTSPFPLLGERQAGFNYQSAQKQLDVADGTKSGAVSSLSGTGLQPQVAYVEAHFPERPGHLSCQYYMKTGDCKFGSSCKFHHPKDRVIPTSPLSVVGLPLRPGQPLCTFYMKYGLCKFGPICKFDHPVSGVAYNPSMTSLFDMVVTPRRLSPRTTLTSESSSEASREVSKPRSSYTQSEVQATHDIEEVSSTAAASST